ncbi:MAG: hypothetical protein WBA90_00360 [Albidovulum sp.]
MDRRPSSAYITRSKPKCIGRWSDDDQRPMEGRRDGYDLRLAAFRMFADVIGIITT